MHRNSCMAAHQYFNMKLKCFTTKKPHSCKYTAVHVYPSCADVSVNTSSSCLLLTVWTASVFLFFLFFSFFFPLPNAWRLSTDCLSPAVLQHGSDLQAWGQQAIIQSLDVLLLISTQGWLRQLLLSTCQHPSVLQGDRIWRGRSTNSSGGEKKREIHKHLPDSKCHALETAYDNPTSSPASHSQRVLLSAWRAWRRCLTGDSCRMRVTVFGHFK